MSKFLFKCPRCGANLLCDDSLNGSTTFFCTNCKYKITPTPNTFTTLENCGWSNFLTVMGTLHLVCAGILFLIGISPQAPQKTFIGIGAVIVAISSIPFFLSAWIVQQIYISNELKRKQIELLIKIYNKK